MSLLDHHLYKAVEDYHVSQAKKLLASPISLSRCPQRSPGYWQAGTLYELPVLALVLMVLGVALSGRHPAFLVLPVLGLGLFLLPSIAGVASTVLGWGQRARVVARSSAQLRQSGFAPGLTFCGNLNGEALLLDTAAGRVAAVDETGKVEVFEVSELDGVFLHSYRVTRLGGAARTRYSLVFSRGDRRCSLLFSSARRARRAFRKARTALGEAVPFHDEAD